MRNELLTYYLLNNSVVTPSCFNGVRWTAVADWLLRRCRSHSCGRIGVI